jgi:predicted DNA-binding transcriptional regulator AlpA
MSKGAIRSAYMRRQAVAFELGITRHTLARLLQKDATFPRFFAITPGIEVIAREDLDAWIQRKRLDSRIKRLVSPSVAKND